MPLSVLTGLPGEGVAQATRDAVVGAASEGRSVLVVVPSGPDAVRTRSLLAADSPVGVRVATLDGLIQAEWALIGDGRRIASGLGRDVLLARSLVNACVTEWSGRGTVGLLGMLAMRAGVGSRDSRKAEGLPGRIIAAVDAYRASLVQHGLAEGAEVCAALGAERPPASLIVADGFVDLLPEHEALICGWSAGGAEVLLSLPWRPECPGTAATTDLIERLRASGAEIDEAIVADALDPELLRIRRDLFGGAEPGEWRGSVSMVVTQGEEAEARHIATTAASLIGSGARPESIVVAFADPGRHSEWLRRAFRDVGVESETEESLLAVDTALGRALLSLRACATGGIARADLAALARTPFSGVPTDQADRADSAWRRGGAARGRKLLRQVTQMDPIIEAAAALSHVPISIETAKKWKNLVDALLVNANAGAAPVTDEDGAIDAAVHRAFCRLVQEAMELGDGEVTADELWERFAVARIAPASARRPGHVLITGIDAVPSGEFAHVIIAGMIAAEIPRRGSEDRLEGESVAEAMRALGIVGDPQEHAKRERRAFFLAAVTATSTLTLTRQGANDEGAPLRESVFWDEFLDLYRRPGDPLPTSERPLLRVVTLDAEGAFGGPRGAHGAVLCEASLANLAGTNEVSPSQIETYLACPYRWFIERKIAAQAPDQALDRSAAGRLAHDALARFYQGWHLREPRVTPGTRAAAAIVASEAVAAAMTDVRTPESLEELVLLESVPPSVVALVERDAVFLPDYAPAHIEWAFGGSAELPAVDIGGVSLKGRADRIDVGPEGLVILDYKRTTASSLAQIRRDGLVQLQLYAVAASRVLGLPVAGGVYRSLKDGSDRGFVLSGVAGAFKPADVIERGEIDALLDAAASEARRVADEMRQGRIEPTPSSASCRYCSAAGFCAKAVR